MRALTQIHSQELNDILGAARIMFSDKKTSTDVEIFRSMFGGLFCEEGAIFGEKIDAYDANKSAIPDVLSGIATELDARAA